MKKRIISLTLVCIMLLCAMTVCTLGSYAAQTELEVKWNSGYVGSCTNANYKNSVSGTNADWQYTDIVTIPKAGTKISFDATEYPSNAVYVFSTWKQSGNTWVIDLDSANMQGTASHESLGQTKTASGFHYEFITDHDNQSIRICINYKSKNTPKIYQESTTEKSTLEQFAAEEFTATLSQNGVIEGLRWYCGYTSSAINTNGSKMEIQKYSADSSANKSYAYTNLFTVPKAGTKISFSLSCSPNNYYNAVTRYKLEGNHYVYDVGFDATDSLIRTGSNPYTYTYVTEKDNEILRLCCRPNTYYQNHVISAPVTVSWVATNELGTAAVSLNQKTVWPDPELISIVTGAPLSGTEVKGLKWTNGYIGSQYHATKAYTFSAQTTKEYYTSDVFTVPKAGTTVYFFDQTFTDFNDGSYTSTSLLALSHWRQSSGTWLFDRTRPYFTGCDVKNILLTSDYRVYCYTTTEDNENIRLSMRYAAMYSSEDPVIPPVYLVEPTDFDTKLSGVDGSYTDRSGDKVSYKLALPKDYDSAKQYTLVFDNSADGRIADYLTKSGFCGMVLSYSGPIDKSLRLLDEVIEHFPVKVSDLLIVGGKELATHVIRFENIRLCQAFICTDASAPKATYTAMKTISDFASIDEAAEWLVGQTESYYPILEGLHMYAIGDSYFGGSALGQHQVWVNLLGEKYGMTYHNYGIGGNTVAQATGISANQPPMWTRTKEIPSDGDIYFIEGGRNDRHYNVPFGENNSTNNTTFKGALNTIIAAIQKKNADALIILVTPWSYAKEIGYLGTNNDYADAMKQLVEYHNDPHIICMYAADANWTGIDMGNAALRAKYCQTSSDVSHLNANGMYYIAPIFEKFIAEQYAAFKSATLTNWADEKHFDELSAIETTAPTEGEVTTAPSDITTAVTDAVPSDTTVDDTPAEKTGCGGVVSIGCAVVIIFGCALAAKKKD